MTDGAQVQYAVYNTNVLEPGSVRSGGSRGYHRGSVLTAGSKMCLIREEDFDLLCLSWNTSMMRQYNSMLFFYVHDALTLAHTCLNQQQKEAQEVGGDGMYHAMYLLH